MTATNSLNGFRLVDSSALADPASFLDQATDIPASLSLWTLPVEAGISGQALTFFTKSFVDPDETITINGNVHASASLPISRRGVHMSRMVSAIDNVSGREWSSFALLLKELVTLVARLQDLPTASIDFDGTAIVHRRTPVSGLRSPDKFGIFGKASAVDSTVSVTMGLRAGIMTACPCTQAFSHYSTVLQLADKYGLKLANEIGEQLVTYTHSQRGELSLELEVDDNVDLKDVYTAMNTGAHLVHELLKRPDEHYFVEQAHRRPQFTEDVVRSVTAEVVGRLSGLLGPQKQVSISCRNIESIHGHDAQSSIQKTLEDLLTCLRQSGAE